MLTQEKVRQALAAGTTQAGALIARRDQLRKQRARLARRRRLAKAATASVSSEAAPRSPGSREAEPRSVLVAEGDSWFDYPLCDVLERLEDEHGYDVFSVAHRGDYLEDMAYRDGQLDGMLRMIDRLLSFGCSPEAILLSGGGNDLTGDHFGLLLNHAASVHPGFNEKILEGLIDERLMDANVRLVGAVSQLCRDRCGGRPLPILLHGYDYSVPDGRGFAGGWGPLPGPWLQPGFQAKGFADPAHCTALVRELIERFNAMQARVAALPEFAHVHFLDLRGTLPTSPREYRKYWANELHPTDMGFSRVAERFAVKLRELRGDS